MNRTSLALGVAIACLAVSAGCERSTPSSEPASTSAVPSAAAPSAAAPAPPAPAATNTQVATAPAVQLEAVPAREDFEEEAAAQITPANLEKQLEALEKELASD